MHGVGAPARRSLANAGCRYHLPFGQAEFDLAKLSYRPLMRKAAGYSARGRPQMPTPSWDRLRIIGNSRLIKLTTIMPLVGYLIVFNQHVVTALHLDNSIFSNVTSECLISRLKLLYFGLFFTGMGSALPLCLYYFVRQRSSNIQTPSS